MSLLWTEYESEFQTLVDTAFQAANRREPDYFASLSPRVQRIIYRDTRYNLDFLYTALLLDDDKIVADYASWLYTLMVSVLPRQTADHTAEYVVGHFETIRTAVQQLTDAGKRDHLLRLLDCAVASVYAAAASGGPSDGSTAPCRYETEIHQYMDCLFHRDTRQALYLVQNFTSQGIPLSDLYVDILAESMRRVGELWHTAKITVDAEHYCTSVTQMAMAQLYPTLLSGQRRDRVVLCACPGTELHEMGARMVADLFESDGWDSIFLGAAVPQDALLESVRTSKPDLVALSVTMPQHLLSCYDMVQAIRQEFPSVKVAVGGKAFESTHEIWRQWPIDLYARDARELLRDADALVEQA